MSSVPVPGKLTLSPESPSVGTEKSEMYVLCFILLQLFKKCQENVPHRQGGEHEPTSEGREARGARQSDQRQSHVRGRCGVPDTAKVDHPVRLCRHGRAFVADLPVWQRKEEGES